MGLKPFSVTRLPRIEFGAGRVRRLVEIVAGYGDCALLVTGSRSLQESEVWRWLLDSLDERGIGWKHVTVHAEPSPDLVDNTAASLRDADVNVVVGIGGGSVLDAAKAIAGLLRVERSVMDYLEGVGPELPYEGPAVPFVAVPTTAGTGSEATKNAVLSVRGASGFKKSFRHEMLVPQYAVVDPDLLATCPAELIAANGMDAITQLMESFVSLRSSPFTDALALSGLAAAAHGLFAWYEGGACSAEGREAMAYAALLSGITLAQAGLGSVHGLAAPLGAFFPIPHGVACGTLVAAATAVNIRAMRAREPENPALDKYAQLASVFTGIHYTGREAAWDHLVRTLSEWTQRLGLPSLGVFGVHESDLDHVVAHSRGSSMQTNPIVLHDEEVMSIVEGRL